MHHGFEAAGNAGPTLLQRLSQLQAGSSSELDMGVLIPLGNHRRGDFDRQFEAEELPWRWKLDTDELALTWSLSLLFNMSLVIISSESRGVASPSNSFG